MKNILNSKERNNAFVIYLLSFVITVAIIVTAVYFNSLIPNAENAHLRERIGDYENQVFIQQKFVEAMVESKALNDSLQILGHVHPLIERNLTENLRNMDLQEGGELYGVINKDIFNFMYDYTVLNKKLINLHEELQDIESLKDELSRAKQELEEANRSLDAYRNSSNLGPK
ncbi:type VI secretion system TssO [Cognataquiflexum rubidum]|uniref:type VI secretion system TssO n=1 Tax=Cognataquiflexum rubidum TaxID=2922273 RepID=UPI001F14383C|nr:type VI secretion system TssO [Cognataquiflexum rubidum]MCH6234207.1 type VI secretion system transmembrane protein TssO [Cognataquiflexum rubidum]